VRSFARQRTALLGDTHIHEHMRFDECLRVLNWIADDLEERKPDLIAHSGDVFHLKSTAKERNAAAAVFVRYASIAPLWITKGNHDADDDLTIFSKLASKHEIRIVNDFDSGTFGGAEIAGLAWPRKAAMLSRVQAMLGNVSIAETDAIAADAIRALLGNSFPAEREQLVSAEREQLVAGLLEPRVLYRPRILIAHAMVRGSTTGIGQPLVGCDMEIGHDDLAASGADFVGIGHIHKGQDWQHGETAVVYAGSPRRVDYGELEPKGYVIVDFDEAGMRWQRVGTPAREMLHAKGAFADAVLSCDHEPSAVAGAEVRFTYTVERDHRQAARREAEKVKEQMIAAGAVAVRLDEDVLVTTRARAPDVVTAKTTEARLRATWAARGFAPDADRAARLVEKAGQIEAEVALEGA
jgi:exonuclease SbcD